MLPFLLCIWALLAQALGEVAVCDHDDTCEPQLAVGANGLLQSKQRTARLDVEGGHRLNVRKSDDGESVVVEFQHQGRQHSYKLEARSVYAVGAKVRRWTADGEKLEDPPPTRTFVSRKHGAWANARLHEDGSVSGLFHHQGALLEVQPEGSERALSLIDGKDTSGVSYRIQRHNASEMLGTRMRTRRKFVHGSMISGDSASKPHGDDPGVENEPSDPLPDDFAREWDTNWGGDRWYPGCYTDDDKPHIFKVSVLTDYKAYTYFQNNGAAVQAAIELAFTESNIVWENQLHTQLVIDDMTLTETTNGVPPWARDDCPIDTWGYNSGIAGKLKSLWDWGSNLPFSGATHIFSGCQNHGSASGTAWEGSLCKAGKNTNLGSEAISWHGGTIGLWKLFSHELGHNFGAAHSFEEGQGATGGIMDYGNGMHDGVMQFNTQYRKDEVCSYFQSRQNYCENNGKFEEIAPTPAPTPAPAQAPTPAPVEGEGPPGPPGPPGVQGNQGPPGPPR